MAFNFGKAVSKATSGIPDEAKLLNPATAIPTLAEQVKTGELVSNLKGAVKGNTATTTPQQASFTPSATSGFTFTPVKSTGVSAGAAINPLSFTASQVGNVNNVNAPQASGFRQDQADLINLLKGQAAGTSGPSAAEALLKAQGDQNLNRQLALAASASGRALPAAQRQIMQGQALANQQAAQQAAILRAQEQLQAQGLLGTTVNQGIGNDLNLSQLGLQADTQNQNTALAQAIENARLGQQGGMFNVSNQLTADTTNQANALQAAIQNAQLGQQANMFNSQGLLNAAQMTDQAKLSRDQLLAQLASGNAQLGQQSNQFNAQQQAAADQRLRDFYGNILGTGASVAAKGMV